MADDAARRMIVVVDTETTGFGHVARPRRDDAVVQIGLAYRSEVENIKTWSETCNPGENILRPGWADQALAVSGLTRDRILKSRSADLVAAEFRSRLAVIEGEGRGQVELRAFNRDLDLPFLAAAPWTVPAGRWGPCIMIAATEFLDGTDARWVGLDAAMRRLNVDWPQGPRHHAGVDAHAALLVLEALERRVSERES